LLPPGESSGASCRQNRPAAAITDLSTLSSAARPANAVRLQVLDASVETGRSHVLGSVVISGVSIPAPPRLLGSEHSLLTLADVVLAIEPQSYASAVNHAM